MSGTVLMWPTLKASLAGSASLLLGQTQVSNWTVSDMTSWSLFGVIVGTTYSYDKNQIVSGFTMRAPVSGNLSTAVSSDYGTNGRQMRIVANNKPACVDMTPGRDGLGRTTFSIAPPNYTVSYIDTSSSKYSYGNYSINYDVVYFSNMDDSVTQIDGQACIFPPFKVRTMRASQNFSMGYATIGMNATIVPSAQMATTSLNYTFDFEKMENLSAPGVAGSWSDVVVPNSGISISKSGSAGRALLLLGLVSSIACIL